MAGRIAKRVSSATRLEVIEIIRHTARRHTCCPRDIAYGCNTVRFSIGGKETTNNSFQFFENCNKKVSFTLILSEHHQQAILVARVHLLQNFLCTSLTSQQENLTLFSPFLAVSKYNGKRQPHPVTASGGNGLAGGEPLRRRNFNLSACPPKEARCFYFRTFVSRLFST
jgi:hypothetical protein